MLKQLIVVLSAGMLSSAQAAPPVTQVTHGWCSPAVANVQGDVTINCHGVDPKIVARLNEIIDVKDKQLVEAVRLANDWVARYQELEARLSLIEDPTEQEQLALALLKEGHLEEAGKLLDEMLEREDEILKRIASTHFNRAKVYSLLLYLAKAIPHYRKAHELVPDNLEYNLELAKTLLAQQELGEAYRLFQEVLKATDGDIQDDANMLLSRAQALEGIAQIIMLAQDGGKEKVAEVARFQEAAVTTYRRLNEITSGEHTFKLAYAISQLAQTISVRDGLHPSNFNSLVNEAADLFEELARQNPDKEPYYLAYEMSTLLLPLASQTFSGDAQPQAMDRILAIHKRIQKTNARYLTADVAGSYMVVALTYLLRMNYTETEAAATQAITILEKYSKLGEESYRALPLLYSLRSKTQLYLNKPEKALESAERAVSVGRQFSERSLLQFGLQLANFLDELASLQQCLGRQAEASQAIADAAQIRNQIKKAKAQQNQITLVPKGETHMVTSVHALHILVKSRAEAASIIKLLSQSGNVEKDFQSYAEQYSIDSAADLGWFKKGVMVKPFEDAAFTMSPGEFSKEPVKSQFGWHVIYVKGKTGN
jgi:tetratricopeptide (TPR) repeat protein